MGKRVSSLDSLYPPFAEQVQKMIDKIEEENLRAYPFETYRSFERQLELYSKGREQRNGKWVVVDGSKIVTKALPGKSWHAYGVATDFVFDGNEHKAGIQWTWEDYDQTKPGNQPLPWKRLGGIGVECGLEWAGNWRRFKEYPHFQNPFGVDRNMLYDILVNDGIEGVFKELDKHVKPTKTVVTMPEVVITPQDIEEAAKPPQKPSESPQKPAQESTESQEPAKPKGLVAMVLDIVLGIVKAFSKKK